MTVQAKYRQSEELKGKPLIILNRYLLMICNKIVTRISFFYPAITLEAS